MYLDFIIDLSHSKGFNVILTIVYQYTKMAHFLASIKDITSEETTNLVIREVFHYHGLLDIISDHGPQLISKSWKHLFRMLKSPSMSPQVIIHKLMVKKSVQIKYLSRIFDASSVINKMIGTINCYILAKFAYNNFRSGITTKVMKYTYNE